MPEPDPTYDVVAVGNAVVDVLVEVDGSVLLEAGLVPGTMALMPVEEADRIHALAPGGVMRSGGSAANAVVGLALLGGRSAFVGKVAADPLGRIFTTDLEELGVAFPVTAARRGASGRCLVLITPDAERTMCTSLGVAGDLEPDDIDEALFAAAALTYIEGYLFDAPAAESALPRAIDVARRHGRRVALSLSDPFCVQRHRDEFLDLLPSLDILFGNEEEVLALTDADDVAGALGVLQRANGELLTTVTLGSRGAVVCEPGRPMVTVGAAPIHTVVDTTGAGDLYAGGFLFGLTHGFDAASCARLGTILAGEVIGHVGARPDADLRALVSGAGLQV